MTESTLDAQKRKEALARYDNLTRRIEAVDRDMSSETDGERLATLREKRADLALQRDAVNAELTANQKRTNGDLDTLQRKVSELSLALASDHPERAHDIICEAADALTRLDTRVLGLEGRVAAIELHLNPPFLAVFLRLVALFVVLFGGTLFWVKDTRDVLFVSFLWIGILLEVVLACLALALWRMAAMTIREQSKRP